MGAGLPPVSEIRSYLWARGLPPVSEIRAYLWARGCRIMSRSEPIRPLTIAHRSGVQSDRSNRNAPNRWLSLNRPALTPTIERPF
jgi:hypothetical protein